MKILIAYDGSESADKGIDDLSRAGQPMEAGVVQWSPTDMLV